MASMIAVSGSARSVTSIWKLPDVGVGVVGCGERIVHIGPGPERDDLLAADLVRLASALDRAPVDLHHQRRAGRERQHQRDDRRPVALPAQQRPAQRGRQQRGGQRQSRDGDQ